MAVPRIQDAHQSISVVNDSLLDRDREHAEPGGTSCEAATTTGAAKVAAGIDCLDGGADIVKRDNDDDVIDDDHDTIFSGIRVRQQLAE